MRAVADNLFPAMKVARALSALLVGAACSLVQAQSGSIETRKEWRSKVDQQQAEIERLKRENDALKAKGKPPEPKRADAALPPLLEMDGLPAEAVKAGQAATASALGLPVVFRDKLKSGGEGPAMVVIPAGRFTIGSSEEERTKYAKSTGSQEWADWEKPVSGVLVGAFALAQTEVTRAQYAAFVRATGRAEVKGCFVWTGEGPGIKLVAERNWRAPGFEQTEDHPVVCVSWNDAKAYAAWLSHETGKTYRLASEAEWEYSARAGTTTSRYWGHDWNDTQACKYANGPDQTSQDKVRSTSVLNCRDGNIYTAAVKGRFPNALGLYDMLGNAYEWVEDTFKTSYSGLNKVDLVPESADHVVRGGSWADSSVFLRAATRHSFHPDFITNIVGFRVARTLKSHSPPLSL